MASLPRLLCRVMAEAACVYAAVVSEPVDPCTAARPANRKGLIDVICLDVVRAARVRLGRNLVLNGANGVFLTVLSGASAFLAMLSLVLLPLNAGGGASACLPRRAATYCSGRLPTSVETAVHCGTFYYDNFHGNLKC